MERRRDYGRRRRRRRRDLQRLPHGAQSRRRPPLGARNHLKPFDPSVLVWRRFWWARLLVLPHHDHTRKTSPHLTPPMTSHHCQDLFPSTSLDLRTLLVFSPCPSLHSRPVLSLSSCLPSSHPASLVSLSSLALYLIPPLPRTPYCSHPPSLCAHSSSPQTLRSPVSLHPQPPTLPSAFLNTNLG